MISDVAATSLTFSLMDFKNSRISAIFKGIFWRQTKEAVCRTAYFL
jgi:hypothetical protein